MPYEDKKAVPQRRPHAVTLDERSHLTVTGVDEVVRFDDTEVSMRTSRGMLTVHGEGLRVGRLAIDTGELAIDGAFDALDYTEETVSGSGFWSRLFGGCSCRCSVSLRSSCSGLGSARRSGWRSTCCACRAAMRAARFSARCSTVRFACLRSGACSCLA